jgi:predicted amidohydrolase
MRGETQIFVAMCNRVGHEDGMDFAGESLIVHPSGNVLCKADDRERLIVQELDLAEARLWREQKRPYLRQRRPECYL